MAILDTPSSDNQDALTYMIALIYLALGLIFMMGAKKGKRVSGKNGIISTIFTKGGDFKWEDIADITDKPTTTKPNAVGAVGAVVGHVIDNVTVG